MILSNWIIDLPRGATMFKQYFLTHNFMVIKSVLGILITQYKTKNIVQL